MSLHILPRLAALSVVFFLFLFTRATAQSSSTPRTLLWRISGNGLSKPSYLFGTMHLSDKRLFRFDDSVYRAIESTDGLAIELNPDEMMAHTINEAFEKLDEDDKPKRLRDLLDREEYDATAKPWPKNCASLPIKLPNGTSSVKSTGG